jgi:predicted alpha-1,6-mannanase (GH76 family)
MRQKERPWDHLGMSRSAWYRRGKPTERPAPPIHRRDIAQHYHVSVRTAGRMNRVAKADPDLARTVIAKLGNWRQAERLIKNPDAHRKWRDANGLPWPVPQSDGLKWRREMAATYAANPQDAPAAVLAPELARDGRADISGDGDL